MSISVPRTRRPPEFHEPHEFVQQTRAWPYFEIVLGRSSYPLKTWAWCHTPDCEDTPSSFLVRENPRLLQLKMQ